jgi:hypothetical protein
MKDFILFLSNYAHSFIATNYLLLFSDTCYMSFNSSTKFLESTVVFNSFSEGRSSTSSRMLCQTFKPEVCF